MIEYSCILGAPSMRIDPEHLPRIGKDPTRVTKPAKREPVPDVQRSDAAQVAGKSNTDGFTLSPGANRFHQLRTRLETVSEPRQSERVARLKALIDAGEYHVDGEKIARAMLADDATVAALGLGPPE
jgi:flagellar biosynthesis anti-sigma factor FlgM